MFTDIIYELSCFFFIVNLPSNWIHRLYLLNRSLSSSSVQDNVTVAVTLCFWRPLSKWRVRFHISFCYAVFWGLYSHQEEVSSYKSKVHSPQRPYSQAFASQDSQDASDLMTAPYVYWLFTNICSTGRFIMFLLNGSLVQKGFCVLGTRSVIILGFAIYYQVEKSTPACCVVHLLWFLRIYCVHLHQDSHCPTHWL